jgi:hypothetical protein
MTIEIIHIVVAIAIGVGATLFMDCWALFLRRAFNIASLNVCLLGRWLLHVPDGVFKHGIAASKTPHPARARLRSLMTHTVYGVGLYLSALAASVFLNALA